MPSQLPAPMTNPYLAQSCDVVILLGLFWGLFSSDVLILLALELEGEPGRYDSGCIQQHHNTNGDIVGIRGW